MIFYFLINTTAMKNKEETKRRLIEAVGEILKTEGHRSLGVNNIARKAEVNKKLIYRYFQNVNGVIEAYVVERDYWMVFFNKMNETLSLENPSSTKELITSILQNQFKFFLTEQEMQRLILWEISEDSPLMRSIHNARESMGQGLLQLSDEHFNDSKVNFRAIAALLVGGIYYTILHTRFNGGIICDVNINSQEGKSEMINAIKQIVGWAFEKAEEK
jgi:AcrR family transcriptional regulator